jgi:hypothetical protein
MRLSKCSASRSDRYIPEERDSGMRWIGGWAGPIFGLDVVTKKNIAYLAGNHQTGSRADLASYETRFKAAWEWSWPAPPSGAESKNAWSFASKSPNAFLWWLGTGIFLPSSGNGKQSVELLVFGTYKDASRSFLARGLAPTQTWRNPRVPGGPTVGAGRRKDSQSATYSDNRLLLHRQWVARVISPWTESGPERWQSLFKLGLFNYWTKLLTDRLTPYQLTVWPINWTTT